LHRQQKVNEFVPRRAAGFIGRQLARVSHPGTSLSWAVLLRVLRERAS
jgi:hypothetical protein